ncbi:MAG: rhomboid family intramembrane serine protease [Deltaproteobacteria bacterium]|nr:rhomboid family intramembrane serine protease [Deltaproteobacteria bacterium]
MIPLRDRNPSGTFPFVTIFLIVVNVLVFLYQLSLGRSLPTFLYQYSLVPARLFYDSAAPVAASIPGILSFFSSMFFHGGWLHIIGNMWYLWIFGDNVEDRLGHGMFIVFYLVCGFVAALFHVVLNPRSIVPVVGASGAIAGVLGAYLVCYPFARVLTLVPIFVFIQLVEIPAIFFLVLWFLLQFFSGTLTIAVTAETAAGGVAWWAHVGGFLCGAVIIKLLPQRKGFQRRRFS